MLPYGGWILGFASLCALIQSLLYVILSVAGAFVYLCVIPVEPYSKPEDFYRVTLVKLYFEGPKCIPDGKYLGKFNEDYKNPDKIKLLTQDLVFAFMVAFAILNAIYFVVSLLFFYNRNPTTKVGKKRLRDVVLGWSILSIVISLVDAFLAIEMVFDVFSLTNYIVAEKDVGAQTDKFSEIFFIPLLLALASSRAIVIWVWNILLGLIFFCKAFSCKEETTTITTTTKNDAVIEELKEVTEEIPTQKPISISRNHPEWNRFRYSMEAVTPFNEPQDPRWTQYPPSEPVWPTNRFRYNKWKDDEGEVNESYVDDDQDVESSSKRKVITKKSPKPEDFDHNLKNFEPGKKKIKIVKGPVGKPVSIPVPPPLPPVESYTC